MFCDLTEKSSKIKPLNIKSNNSQDQLIMENNQKVSLDIPDSMYQGQDQSLQMTLENVGNAPLSHLHLVHHSPGLFLLEQKTPMQKPTLFDFQLISDNNAHDEKFMDIIPIPLNEPLKVNSLIQP